MNGRGGSKTSTYLLSRATPKASRSGFLWRLGPRSDFRQGRDPCHQVLVELVGTVVVVVDLPRIEPDGHEVRGIEPEIDLLRDDETSNEETGHDQQRKRAGNLPDNEKPADA